MGLLMPLLSPPFPSSIGNNGEWDTFFEGHNLDSVNPILTKLGGQVQKRYRKLGGQVQRQSSVSLVSLARCRAFYCIMNQKVHEPKHEELGTTRCGNPFFLALLRASEWHQNGEDLTLFPTVLL